MLSIMVAWKGQMLEEEALNWYHRLVIVNMVSVFARPEIIRVDNQDHLILRTTLLLKDPMSRSVRRNPPVYPCHLRAVEIRFTLH
jgi:hypothetical protein